jgi:hypothetical protein
MEKQDRIYELTDNIKGMLDDVLPISDSQYDNIRRDILNLLSNAESGYVLIEWPDSQDYMEEEWFREEAILALGSEEKTGSSAYFIPIRRLFKHEEEL